MLMKINITGTITLITGMHIGGPSGFSAIGAIDSSVIRDIQTDQPMIPGSSFKGKMRSLLAKQYADGRIAPQIKFEDDCIKRLFGYMDDDNKKAHPARLQVSDMFLSNKDKLDEAGIPMTEVKFENTINRATAVANPRQIERAVAGSQFDLDLMYNVENINEIKEDFQTIANGLKLLSYDYLGGHGSRGYGRIKFSDLYAEEVVGEPNNDEEEIINECNKLLSEVSKKQ